MLKAPDHNEDAAERYDAFKETAEYYRLEIKPENVVTTNLSSNCREECDKLLDQNPDAEAIFCANDDIAIGPVHLSGLAIAALVGIFLNAIMPVKLGMKVKSFKGKEKD